MVHLLVTKQRREGACLLFGENMSQIHVVAMVFFLCHFFYDQDNGGDAL